MRGSQTRWAGGGMGSPQQRRFRAQLCTPLCSRRCPGCPEADASLRRLLLLGLCVAHPDAAAQQAGAVQLHSLVQARLVPAR